MTKHNLTKQDKSKIKQYQRAKQALEINVLHHIHTLDREIANIQRSTKTTIPMFIPLHNNLRAKFSWYYFWHLKSFANLVHIVILTLFILFTTAYIINTYVSTSKLGFAASLNDYTWDGGGDGSTWTDADNWGGTGYPQSEDDRAIIDSGSASITIPASTTLGALELRTGYSGTVTVGGTLTLEDATDTDAGDIIINAGTLSCSANNPNINVRGDISIGSGGTFTKGTGTLTFTGTVARTFTDSNSTKQNMGIVVVGKTSGTASNNKITLSSSMTVDTMTINSNNTLDLGSSSYILKLANAGSTATVLTNSGTLTPGTSTVEYSATNSGGNINITTTTYNSLKTSGSETYDLTGSLTSTNALTGDLEVGSGSTLDVRPASTDYNITCRDVTVIGTLDGTSSSATLEATRNWTHSSGTFNYGTTTVKLTGDGSLNSSDSKRFYKLQMAFTGKTTTLANSVRVDNVLTTQTGNIATSVGWNGYVTMFGTGSNYVTDATTPATWGSETQISFYPYGNVTFPKAQFNNLLFRCNYPGNCDFTMSGDLTVANDIDLRGAGAGKKSTLNTNGYNLSVANNIKIGVSGTVNNYGELNINGSTVTTAFLYIYASDASEDNELVLSGTTPSLSVTRDFSNADLLTAGTGSTVTFNGSVTNQTLTTGGTGTGKSFYNLTVNIPNGNTSYDALIISGNLEVDNNLTVSDGELDLATNNPSVYVSGDVSIASGAVFTKGTGTFTLDGETAKTFTDSNSTKQNMGIVVIGKTSGTASNNKITLSSSMTVDTMTINSNNTLDLGSSSYILKLANAGSTATVLTNSGTLTPGTSTVEYAATNSGGNINITTTTYNSLKTSGSETYDLTGSLTSTNALTGDLEVGSGSTLDVRPASTDYSITAVNVTIVGTVDCTSSATILSASGNWTHASGTFTQGSSTVKLTGTGNLDSTDAKPFSSLELAYTSHTTTLITSAAVYGNLTTQTGTIEASGGTRYIAFFGNYTTDGTTPATWDVNTQASWYINTSRSLAKSSFYDLILRGNGTVTLTLTGAVTVNNDLTIRGNNAGQSIVVDTDSNSISVTNDLFIGVSGSTDRYAKLTNNGSAITVGGDVTIYASDASGDNVLENTSTSPTLSIGENYTNNDVFTAGTGTVTFTATGTGKTLAGNLNSTNAFYNLIFNGSGGGWSNSSAMLIGNDLTVTAGTLSGTNNITVSGGDTTGNGTINLTGGTFVLDGGGNFGGNTNWTFYALNFGDAVGTSTTTKTGSGSIIVTSILTLTSNQSLYAGDDTWTLSGSGTPLSILGNFYCETSTFNYTATGTTNVTGTTYYNLGVGTTSDSTAVTYSAAMNITIGGVLTIGNSGSSAIDTFSGSNRTITLSGSGTPLIITSMGDFSESTSTVNYTGSSSTNVTTETYYNLGVGTTADSNAVTYSLLNNITVTQYLTIGNISSGVNDTLSASSYQISLSRASGTPFAITAKGIFDPGTGTVRYYGNGSITVTGTSYYNLLFDPTLTSANRVYSFTATTTIGNSFVIQPTDSSSPYYKLTVLLGGNATVTGSTVITRGGSATSELDTSGSSYDFTSGGLTVNAGGTFDGEASNVIINGNITIASSGTFSNTSAVLSVSGNFANSGTFTANGGDVEFTGGDSTTQEISGNTTFANFLVSTYANSAGRTIQFAGGSTQTITGNFNITGYSGKVITLQSSNTSNWTINPTAADVAYVSVSRSTNTGVSFCAIYSTDGGNNVDWDISSSGSCGGPPNSPTSLAQKKTNDDSLSVGSWTDETSVKFTALADDPDNPDTLYLCVEKDLLGTSFSDTEDSCGSGVAYSGTAVTVTVTIAGITDASQYHWQARVKDTDGTYSSWVSFGGNSEAERDFGTDTTAPTGGTVIDILSGGSTDIDENDGDLNDYYASWSGFDASASGLASYSYALRRSSDSYYWNSTSSIWQSGEFTVSAGTNTSAHISSVTLKTSENYYFSVQAIDNASNESSWVNSDGMMVSPFISFSLSSYTLQFDNLTALNTYTDTKTNVVTTSTNAYSGYVVRAYKDGLLTGNGKTVPDYSGTYASPTEWTAGNYGFGYTSNDTTIGGSNKFGSGTLFAAFATGPNGDTIADYTNNIDGSTGELTNDAYTITYKIAVSSIQSALTYSGTITYIVVPQF